MWQVKKFASETNTFHISMWKVKTSLERKNIFRLSPGVVSMIS
jgi:hypothetical protein